MERDIRSKVTKFSLDRGLIPMVCPICHNKLERGKLEEHHWGCKSQDEAFEKGNTRRMCAGCNRLLGRGGGPESLYSKMGRLSEARTRSIEDEDLTWDEQWELISSYFKRQRVKYSKFDGEEKPWSQFLPIEEEILRKFQALGVDSKEQL